MFRVLLAFLGIALIILIALFLGAAIFWGLGNLAIFVFNIEYTWTIWHGLFCELLYILLKELLTRD